MGDVARENPKHKYFVVLKVSNAFSTKVHRRPVDDVVVVAATGFYSFRLRLLPSPICMQTGPPKWRSIFACRESLFPPAAAVDLNRFSRYFETHNIQEFHQFRTRFTSEQRGIIYVSVVHFF